MFLGSEQPSLKKVPPAKKGVAGLTQIHLQIKLLLAVCFKILLWHSLMGYMKLLEAFLHRQPLLCFFCRFTEQFPVIPVIQELDLQSHPKKHFAKYSFAD